MENNSVLSEDAIKILEDLSNRLKDMTNKSYDQTTKDYQYHISVVEKLGKSGWTIHDSITPNNLMEWIHEIQFEGESIIAKYYSDAVIENIFDEMHQNFYMVSEAMYVDNAIKNYKNGRYTETAFFCLHC